MTGDSEKNNDHGGCACFDDLGIRDSRMAGLSETDTLKSVTVLHIVVGCSGFVIILILSQLLPLNHF